MKSLKPFLANALWVLAGALLLGLLLALVFHFQSQSVSAQIDARLKLLQAVGEMQLRLESSVEAEKTSVMAATDADSHAFADKARAEAAVVEQLNAELGLQLRTARERELQAQFTTAFTDLKRIDAKLLDLAVRNSNVKATALAFGPAAQAAQELDASLTRLSRKNAVDARVVMLASGVDESVLRIQALLPRHIAEEHDPAMDALEARMSAEERLAATGLRDLDGLLPGDPDLRAAHAGLSAFLGVEKQVIRLSRDNTNVKSLSLSLNEKRKATAFCQEALTALYQAIDQERIPGEDTQIPR
jgi:hypothetical protein